MRPIRPWRLEPTLRYLATLPLAVAVAGIGIELAIRASGGSAVPGDRPAWLMAVGTGLIHALALLLLVPLLRAHGLGWRDAFGMFSPGWLRKWCLAAAWTLPALGLASLLHQGSGWVLDRVGIPHDAQAAVDAVRSADRWWELGLLLFFAAVSAPLVEEILFRGVLWPHARESGWRLRGAAMVSLLFALIHFNAAALLPLWMLGLFWTWLYERSEDLTVPMVSHALFNGLNFVWIIAAPSPSGT